MGNTTIACVVAVLAAGGPPELPDLPGAPASTEPAVGPAEVEPAAPVPSEPPPPPVTVRAGELGDPTAGATVADPFDRPPPVPAEVPRWMKVGLGLSAGFSVASLVSWVVVGGIVRNANQRRGRLYDTIAQAADDSTRDGIGDGQTSIDAFGLPAPGSIPNDVPNQDGVDPCRVATHRPDPTSSAVWNSEVAAACRKGDVMAMAATGMAGVFFVSLASTAVFTGLTIARARRAKRSSAVAQHGLRIDAAHVRGGMLVGASGRF